jgi:hypothetical protein
MDNPEKLATLSTQYTGRRKITKKKQQQYNNIRKQTQIM